MTSVELSGLGIWSENFSNWEQFCAASRGELVTGGDAPQPTLIPARERRRAPLFVKMALDVMEQASLMAGIDRASLATVFASGMGDMQTTDYMCATLAAEPRTISPTKFHNSVHNAATGYWSIGTESHAPANAVSGYQDSGALALLESAIQVAEEDIPVLFTLQEMAPPTPFQSVYSGRQPLAISLLLTPPGSTDTPVGRISIQPVHGDHQVVQPDAVTDGRWDGNFAAMLMELLFAVSAGKEARLMLPASTSVGLAIHFAPAVAPVRGDG